MKLVGRDVYCLLFCVLFFFVFESFFVWFFLIKVCKIEMIEINISEIIYVDNFERKNSFFDFYIIIE